MFKESGIKEDVIKPLDMNHVSTILVGNQFYKCQYLFKILKCTSKISVIERIETNKR